MSYKLLTSCLLTITISLCGLPHGWAQINSLTVAAPDAATSFSTFSVPQNMGPAINSASIDEHPIIAPSGLSFYFASDRPGGLGGRDIYVSQRATLSSAWGAAQNVGALNTNSNEVDGSMSPDGREMFMNSARADGIGGTDLYLSTRTDPTNDSGWTTPVNLGAVINSTFGEQNPNYFVDPATGAGTLFFSSDRGSGTAGVKDFYQSTRNADGTFNPPSLVNELNSAADEARTGISRDGLEIFFSSNRLVPTTNQALFVSTRASTSANWNPPVHMASLSSVGSNAQPALSPDGTILYYVSNRPGGSGTGDLYASTRVSVNRSSTADFDGDGRSDLSVFRPSDGNWWVMESSTNTVRTRSFGQSGDRVVAGDYDGDGRTDRAIFRPSNGEWWILRSSNDSILVLNWGLATDKPAPGDYDGDGRADIAVYRDGTWYIIQSSNGNFRYEQFGTSSDVPVTSLIAQ